MKPEGDARDDIKSLSLWFVGTYSHVPNKRPPPRLLIFQFLYRLKYLICGLFMAAMNIFEQLLRIIPLCSN